MTKIKLCGLSRPCDIYAVNALNPEYIGFVFAKKSKRYVSPSKAAELKQLLSPGIQAVGVFVNEDPERIAGLLQNGTIDMVQLHGDEDEAYIARLHSLTPKPIIKAFPIVHAGDMVKAGQSTADFVLLDSGAGTGTVFDWKLIEGFNRPYFLAGGLSADNVGAAVDALHPYAVDVSSGIETNGYKDQIKMAAFAAAVRKEDRI